MPEINGLKRKSDVFRKAIDKLLVEDEVFAPITNIPTQQLLDNTLALFDIVKNTTGAVGQRALAEATLASLIRKVFLSGVTHRRGWGEAFTGDDGAILLEPSTWLLHGHEINIPIKEIEMLSPPESGTRSDLVYLEMWPQMVDPKTGMGLIDAAESIDDPVAYAGGDVAGEPVPFNSVFPDVSQAHLQAAEPGDIVRLQVQWRIVVAENVDFGNHPLGITDPSVGGFVVFEDDRAVFVGGVQDLLVDGDHLVDGNTAFDENSTISDLFKALFGIEPGGESASTVYATPLFRVVRSAGNNAVTEADVTDLRFTSRMRESLVGGFIHEEGGRMLGDLEMSNDNGITFGDRFRMVYNPVEDSLDIVLL